ncbi:unnamed protein product [Effrenium voratum]|uniref:Nudix hydrolase domain-containing protein n=1 Tax=Effrenium voratum TaxID=2562239 RepID=A0AA36II18_9DINO|nr:unnamed protein product [Effrenium voratum]CAJ1414199.1 unnamed protein product [Effrenium voratum]
MAAAIPSAAPALGLALGPRPGFRRLGSGALARRAPSSRRGAAVAVAMAARSMRGLMRRIADCNDGLALLPQTRPLLVEGRAVGKVLPKAAQCMGQYDEVFRVTDEAVELIAGDTLESRSQAVHDVVKRLRDEDRVPMLRGWRDEDWPVKPSFHDEPVLVIERSAGPLLGVQGFGCHINGIVEGEDNVPMLWVAKRAETKPTYPGLLDNIVAGGLSDGELPRENVIRECWEEAGVPKALAAEARPASVVSYSQVDETGWGVKRDVLLCYDLALPKNFTPFSNDEEVDSFQLWSMDRVLESLESETRPDWKPNVALVIIDMLVRRGFLKPEEPGYVELIHALRV